MKGDTETKSKIGRSLGPLLTLLGAVLAYRNASHLTSDFDISHHIPFYRYVTTEEMQDILEYQRLRFGRPGQTFFTTEVYDSAAEAFDKLALPVEVQYRVKFTITSSDRVFGPEPVPSHTYGDGIYRAGGGVQYWANAPPPVMVSVLEVTPLG